MKRHAFPVAWQNAVNAWLNKVAYVLAHRWPPIYLATRIQCGCICSVSSVTTVTSHCNPQCQVLWFGWNSNLSVHLIDSFAIFHSCFGWPLSFLLTFHVFHCPWGNTRWCCGAMSLYRAAMVLVCAMLDRYPFDHRVSISANMFSNPSIWPLKNSSLDRCMAHLWTLDKTCCREFGRRANGANTYNTFLWSMYTCVCFAPHNK